MDKKGMSGALVPVAYGIVAVAIMIGIGMIVITNFAGSQAVCAGQGSCGASAVYNQSTDTCSNATAVSCGTPDGTAYSTLTTVRGYLGTSSGGLVTWIPAIIALVIGILFLSYFLGKKKSY